jgi:hypothetical protein
LTAFAAGGARAGELDRTSILAEYDSGEERFKEADRVLNEARLATSDPVKARRRIRELEGILSAHPDYPHRPMVQYFLGLNLQLVGEYGRAAVAFEAALAGKPDLSRRTPVRAYLDLARKKQFAHSAPRYLLGALALVLLASVLPLFRADLGRVPWRRLCFVFGAALLAWTIAVLLVPPLVGVPDGGIEGYPTPTLANVRLGQIGDGVLRSLLSYGLGAILAAGLVSVGTSLIRSRAPRAAAMSGGGLLVAGLIMALFYVQHCYGRCKHYSRGGRLVFLVKDIAWKKEVPDEMLPFYDEDFRRKILEARKAAAKDR